MAGALMDVASHPNLIRCRFILCRALARAARREWLESSATVMVERRDANEELKFWSEEGGGGAG